MRVGLSLCILVVIAGCGGNTTLSKPPNEWPDYILVNRCAQPFLHSDMDAAEWLEIDRRDLRSRCSEKKEAMALTRELSAERVQLSKVSPTEWTDANRRTFRALKPNEQCGVVKSWRRQGSNPAIRRALAQSAGRNGLNSQDIDIILDPKYSFGTGMSFYGVKCIGGRIVNTSFYPGSGHQWQMEVGDSFVYLNGGGREDNMTVSAWN